MHDELDVRYLAQESVGQRLADAFTFSDASTDQCWWCSRPAAPIESSLRQDGELLYEAPVLCDVCVGLSGHVAGGFATADEVWEHSVEQVFRVLDREREIAAPGLRERSVELVLAKLALLEAEREFESLVYPCDGIPELASSLGLSEVEARAQVMRLWNESDSAVTFRRFDDGVVPVPSASGRRRLEALVRQYQRGAPFDAPPRSPSLRRALERLEAELQPAPR